MTTRLRLAYALALVVLTSACGPVTAVVTNNHEVEQAIADQGYSDVMIVSTHYFFVGLQGCGHGDTLSFEVRATNALNKPVHLLACTGILKGVTIRTK